MEPPPREPRSVRAAYQRSGARLWATLGLIVALGAAAMRLRPFRIEVHGPSMEPTLEPGDWAIATAGGSFRRGNIVVVEHPGQPGFEMVKRVIAVPGDMAPDGRVLGPGEFWVEGDEPRASTDSRHFGPVTAEALRGRVRLVYFPMERRRVL